MPKESKYKNETSKKNHFFCFVSFSSMIVGIKFHWHKITVYGCERHTNDIIFSDFPTEITFYLLDRYYYYYSQQASQKKRSFLFSFYFCPCQLCRFDAIFILLFCNIFSSFSLLPIFVGFILLYGQMTLLANGRK